MNIGQWLGNYKGAQTGSIALNIELINGDYIGQIILLSNDANLPSYVATIKMQITNLNSAIISEFIPIDPRTKLPAFSEDDKKSLSALYPNIKIPINGSLTISQKSDTELNGIIKTCTLKSADFILKIFRADKRKAYQAEVKTWDEYKLFIKTLDPDHYIFRGQPKPFPLRTTFHRHNRYNLMGYSMCDIHILHRHICAESGKLYNLQNQFEYGALLNLAQHYGYPTPLLDWTLSPYIAAYFAFSDINQSDENSFVRIFVFDRYNWNIDYPPVTDIGSTTLSLSLFEFMAINNNRAIPQQSITMFSNIDDIEAFIKYHEKMHGKNYFTIIDLPTSERKKVLSDLFQMGITASSLFPGAAGACKMLREKYF